LPRPGQFGRSSGNEIAKMTFKKKIGIVCKSLQTGADVSLKIHKSYEKMPMDHVPMLISRPKTVYSR
jgi:hypothetical protein